MNPHKHPLAGVNALLLLASLCVIGLVFTPSKKHPPLSVNASLSEMRSYWNAEIDTVGPSQSYAEFKVLYASSTTQAHVAAHVIGDLLYKKLGMQGFGVCDESFGYGCQHAFLAQALLEQGPEAIKNTAHLCGVSNMGTSTACEHGVGHGILAYYGTEHIPDALSTCSYLFGVARASACAHGVFMEYNIPLSLDGDVPEVHVRPFDRTHPLSPCTMQSIPEVFRDACYLSLAPNWWAQVGGIRGISELCASAPAEHQKACYVGIGLVLPGVSLHKEEKIIAECKKLADKEKIVWCLTQSAEVQEQFKQPACSIYAQLGVASQHRC